MKFDCLVIFDVLIEVGIGFRIIIGGNFLWYDVIKYYDYIEVLLIVNVNIVYDNGFFVGNYLFDLSVELVKLCKVLDNVVKEVI